MGITQDPVVRVFENATLLAVGIAEFFAESAKESIARSGFFRVALAGGTTPKVAYKLLSSREYAARVDWSSIYIFWGDERCVLPVHHQSNYRMVYEALLAHVPIPKDHIFRMEGERHPRAGARSYEEQLRSFFAEEGEARFDLLLLGMGDDGHTASLFPDSPAINERERWTQAVYVEPLDSWRITLTPPAINAAREVIFMVTGEEKSERLRQVLYGDYRPDVLPIQIVRPVNGTVLWFVDSAAAAKLNL